MNIKPGDRVRCRDVSGDWHEMTACSRVQQGRDFLLVWVAPRPPSNGEFDPTPWPADAVEVLDP